MNRNELQEAYINLLIDGMDHKTMHQFVYDTLNDNLKTYSENEILHCISELYCSHYDC